MRRPAAALVLLAVASGCASVERRRARDASDLARLVHERIGVEPRLDAAAGESIPPQARALLEQPLTDLAVLEIALLNNRAVRAALAELGVASAEVVQAGLPSNPVLSADAKLFGHGTEIEVGILGSLFDVFFLSARRRVSEAELEVIQARVALEIVELAHDVRRAGVRLRAAGRLAEVESEVLRAAQASFDLMAELHRAGNVIDPRLTAEELSLARALLAVDAALTAVAEAREPLNVLMGLSGGEAPWTLAGTLGEDPSQGLELDLLETRAVEASLELAELRAEATAEARRVGIAGWQAVLDPGEIGLAAKREVGESEWGIGPALGFALPVFDSGGVRRAVVEGRLRASQARHVSRAVEVRSAARRLRERSMALSERAAFIREEQLPLAARLVRETLRNYNAMQVGAFEVLVAKQQEIDATRGYVETLREAWLARIDLEELLAGRLNHERVVLEPGASGHSTSLSIPAEH